MNTAKTPENYERLLREMEQQRTVAKGESQTGHYLDDLDKRGLKIVIGTDHRGEEYPSGGPHRAPRADWILGITDPGILHIVRADTCAAAEAPFDRTVDYLWPYPSMILWK